MLLNRIVLRSGRNIFEGSLNLTQKVLRYFATPGLFVFEKKIMVRCKDYL